MIVIICNKFPPPPPRFKDLCSGEVFRLKGHPFRHEVFMKVGIMKAVDTVMPASPYNSVLLRTGELKWFPDGACIEPVSGQFEES